MSWDLALFIVNVLAMFGVVVLLAGSPCWMQSIFLGLLLVAFGIVSVSYGWAAIDSEDHWRVRGVGQDLQHVALLLYIFRLVYQGRVQWKPSSSLSSTAH